MPIQKRRAANRKLNQLHPGYQTGPEDARSQERHGSASRYEGHLELPSHGAGLLPFFLPKRCLGHLLLSDGADRGRLHESFGSVINPLVGLDSIGG